MISDGDEIYIKFVDLDEIYNYTSWQNFYFSSSIVLNMDYTFRMRVVLIEQYYFQDNKCFLVRW